MRAISGDDEFGIASDSSGYLQGIFKIVHRQSKSMLDGIRSSTGNYGKTQRVRDKIPRFYIAPSSTKQIINIRDGVPRNQSGLRRLLTPLKNGVALIGEWRAIKRDVQKNVCVQ